MTELSTALRVPAAQYIRMSTEHQRYSLENQITAIEEYAEARGFAVVRTYADAGKSGLSLKGRDGLQGLLADVVTGQRNFSAVLVLDVSRWGRFPDADQSAHYEFLCRSSGVRVVYCGEPFENDGSMISTIVKNLKRVMASEYSRELSVKIARAKIQQAQLGFHQGAKIPFGVRRVLISNDGQRRFLLRSGEAKGLNTDRVVFAPGPPEELKTVRRIFQMFVDQKRSMMGIARTLNVEEVPSTDGLWSERRIRAVLQSELMIGYYVYNQTSKPLSGPCKRNPPNQWIRTRVMNPIVDPKRFAKAQREMGFHRNYFYAKADILKRLRRLFRETRKLSQGIINNCPYTPCAEVYRVRFGSLHAAYAAAGYKCRPAPRRGREYTDEELIAGVRRLHAKFGFVTIALINADRELPSSRMLVERFGSIMEAYRLAGFPTTKEGAVLAAWDRGRKKGREKYSDAELLEGIQTLCAKFGYVTVALIEAAPDLPSRRVFRQRFGSLTRAYALAGVPIGKPAAVRDGKKRRWCRFHEALRCDPTRPRGERGSRTT
ncbi:recombinase family protein [Mesorhizobium sp. M7A.F.Ca.MR.362.00.0.0]|uniref:recombinase family protein n=1 Tax=Mesorhizobium sp. M7A.F.Ca.MR.362.00.0.0 TaxID=2496779 RepID=UPI000FD5F345|nr:recombinase family protein [Mesorhizobium sp. M7A.F.Ca.MR.362.00.0.0]RUU82750.1 recombinase family protein [Mesorhizobium sp. M7A.F.Ca.MR.362.00.0.0]